MSRIAALLVACAALSLFGCGPAGSTDAGVDAGTDAGVGESVNGCTPADFAAHDLSLPASSRTITFPSVAAPAQYSTPCFTIAVGQSVTWNGDFSSHPLSQVGGDPSMWITTTSSGTTATFAFPVGGTYGFECLVHPSLMKGAIFVK
jgi:plastocyanin